MLSGDADSSISSSFAPIPTVSNGTNDTYSTDFVFRSKGLHIANLNVRHLLPKLDELRISMACENGPNVLGICETFLNDDISCNQLTVNGFDHTRKDRSVVGCPLIGLLPSDVNAKVCMYSYKCKGTDLRTHGSRNLIHTQTSTALRTDERTDERTNPKPTRRLGCHHAQADVTPMNRIGKVRISGYKLVVCGEQSQ